MAASSDKAAAAAPDAAASSTATPAPSEAVGAASQPSGSSAIPTAPVAAAASAASTYTLEDAVADVRLLREQIEADCDELSLAAPARQRLVLLAWIARARECQEGRVADGRIRGAVSTVASTLSRLARAWWPGSIRALQLTAGPGDAMRELGHHGEARGPLTWSYVASVAEDDLRKMEAEDTARGYDALGWADPSRLEPPPADPDAMLDAMVRDVEARGGILGELPDDSAVPDPKEMLQWVRQLRWLRIAVANSRQWGALAGRLRYWCHKHASSFAAASKEISTQYAPPQSWASVLGMDPRQVAQRADEERRRGEIEQLLVAVPTGEPAPSDEALNDWLARALRYSDTHAAAIAEAMRPLRDRILVLDAQQLPGADRHLRKRLAKLKKTLDSPAPSPTAAPRPVAVTPPPAEEVDTGPRMPPELIAQVLPRTRGQRALFISNRSDPELFERIQALFEFRALEWAEAEPRRIDAASNAIASRKYDIVLGATGFLDHTVDGRLARASRVAGVPYIRVHRGRPLASLQAVARELGRRGQQDAS